VEERPKPTPGVISEITTEPLTGPEEPFISTRHIVVILSELISTRDVPRSGTLPERTVDILSKMEKVSFLENILGPYAIR